MMLFVELHLKSHSQSLQVGMNLTVSHGLFHPGILLCMVRLNGESAYFLLLDLFNIRNNKAKVKKQWFILNTQLWWKFELGFVSLFFFFSLFQFAFKQSCGGHLHTCQHMHFHFSSPKQSTEGWCSYWPDQGAAAAKDMGTPVDVRLPIRQTHWLTPNQQCPYDCWLKLHL